MSCGAPDFLGVPGAKRRGGGVGFLSQAEAQDSMVVAVLGSSLVSSGVGQRCPIWKYSWKSRSSKRDPSCARLWAFGGSHGLGSHECGMGSFKKGFSVHPEVVFGALGAEEVPIITSRSLFSALLSP